MGLATAIEIGVDGFLSNFVTNVSAKMCSDIMPLALTGASLFIVFYGYAVIRNAVEDSLHTFIMHAIKMSLIAGVALSGGEYQSVVINFINGLQSALITTVSGSTSVGAAIDHMGAPYEALENALYTQAFTDWMPAWSLVLAAVITTLAHVAVVLTSIGMYMVAKVCLCLVLAVGPIFIACAMFSGTQRFTESWIAQALQFILLNTLIAASLAMVTSFAETFAAQVSSNATAINIIRATVNLLIVSLALVGVVLKLDMLSSALTGGVSFGGFAFPKPPRKTKSDKEPTPPTPKNEIEPAKPNSNDNKQPNGHGSNNGYSNSGRSRTPLYQQHVLSNIRRA